MFDDKTHTLKSDTFQYGVDGVEITPTFSLYSETLKIEIENTF